MKSMTIANSMGESMHPCLKPVSISNEFVVVCQSLIQHLVPLCISFSKYIHFAGIPQKNLIFPHCASVNKLLIKSPLKVDKMKNTGIWWVCVFFPTMVYRASVWDRCGLNPFCLSLNTDSSTFFILFKVTVHKTLYGSDERVIPVQFEHSRTLPFVGTWRLHFSILLG